MLFDNHPPLLFAAHSPVCALAIATHMYVPVHFSFFLVRHASLLLVRSLSPFLFAFPLSPSSLLARSSPLVRSSSVSCFRGTQELSVPGMFLSFLVIFQNASSLSWHTGSILYPYIFIFFYVSCVSIAGSFFPPVCLTIFGSTKASLSTSQSCIVKVRGFVARS